MEEQPITPNERADHAMRQIIQVILVESGYRFIDGTADAYLKPVREDLEFTLENLHQMLTRFFALHPFDPRRGQE